MYAFDGVFDPGGLRRRRYFPRSELWPRTCGRSRLAGQCPAACRCQCGEFLDAEDGAVDAPAAFSGFGDAVVLVYVASGAEHVEHGDSQSIVHRGRTLVCRSDTKIRFATSEGLRKRTLVIPFSQFNASYIDRYVRYAHAFEESRPVVGLLRSFLTEVWPRIRDMDKVELEATRNSVLALVLGMTRAADTVAEDSDLLPALHAQIGRWIDERLPFGPIRVTDAAAAHHVSTRTVQRAFAADGVTFGATLWGRRLERARQDLVHTMLPISEIAYRWGYYDTSHFGREFRRRFDCSPQDYREVHGRGTNPGSSSKT